MKPSFVLLFAGAILWLVSMMVGEDSQISNIARKDSESLRASYEASNMKGFTSDSKLGLLPEEEEPESREKQAEADTKQQASIASQAAASTSQVNDDLIRTQPPTPATKLEVTPDGNDEDKDWEKEEGRPRIVKISNDTE